MGYTMPRLTPQAVLDAAYKEISNNPGITVTGLAEALGITRDSAKHMMWVSLENLAECEPDKKFRKPSGRKPVGYMIWK